MRGAIFVSLVLRVRCCRWVVVMPVITMTVTVETSVLSLLRCYCCFCFSFCTRSPPFSRNEQMFLMVLFIITMVLLL